MPYFYARFFDGKRSQPLEAKVEVGNDITITLEEENTQEVIHWQAKSLQVMEAPHHGRPASIGCKEMPGARLVISNESDYAIILALVLRKHIKHAGVKHSWLKMIYMLAASLLLLIVLLWGFPKTVPFLARNIPTGWDEALGQYVITELSQKNSECVSPQGLKALNKLVDKLTKDEAFAQISVKVFSSKNNEINAFAAPGNQIVIWKGLLDFASSADEVAGVLAHEIGHVLEHHPTQSAIRKVGLKVILTSAFGSHAELASLLLNLKYSRQDEQQADDIAIRLLSRANIDTRGFKLFFEKLAYESNIGDEPEILQYFSDHPGLLERAKRIQEDNTGNTPSLSKKEWEALKKICQKTNVKRQ